MKEQLVFFVTYMLTILCTGPDFIVKKTQQIQLYFQKQPLIKISANEELKNYLMQGNYQRCIILIQANQTIPTKEHFDLATRLSLIESKSNNQNDAHACARFIYDNLIERKIIVPEKPRTRTTEQSLAELQQNTQGMQGQFLRAIELNDIQQMRRLLRRGAQPNLSSNSIKPVQLAIARGHKDALAVLYNAGVPASMAHLEQARIHYFLWQSNASEPGSDILFTTTNTTNGYTLELHKYHDICCFIADKIRQQATTR